MKYVNLLLCAVMVLFALVQYNDPDALYWGIIYLVPAVWAALAALRPQTLRATVPATLLGISVVAALAGTVYYWPATPDFWRVEVWWNTETAREGMGMMMVTLTVVVALLTAMGRRPRQSG